MTGSNPYRTPDTTANIESAQSAKEKVSSPAIALIVVTGISLVLLFGSSAASLKLLLSGTFDELPVREGAPLDRETTTILSLCLRGFFVFCQFVILIGAINMRKLRNLQLATVAAILSCVPCVSPCYLLGIPFGIWALTVLGDPKVKEAFE